MPSMQNAHFSAHAIDLVASFGRALPPCPNCNLKMVMSCREAWPSEPLIFTFECRGCCAVMHRAKARAFGRQRARPIVPVFVTYGAVSHWPKKSRPRYGET